MESHLETQYCKAFCSLFIFSEGICSLFFSTVFATDYRICRQWLFVNINHFFKAHGQGVPLLYFSHCLSPPLPWKRGLGVKSRNGNKYETETFVVGDRRLRGCGSWLGDPET